MVLLGNRQKRLPGLGIRQHRQRPLHREGADQNHHQPELRAVKTQQEEKQRLQQLKHRQQHRQLRRIGLHKLRIQRAQRLAERHPAEFQQQQRKQQSDAPPRILQIEERGRQQRENDPARNPVEHRRAECRDQHQHHPDRQSEQRETDQARKLVAAPPAVLLKAGRQRKIDQHLPGRQSAPYPFIDSNHGS